MNESASDNSRRSPAPAPPVIAQPATSSIEIAPTSLESIPIDFGDDEEAMLEYALTLSRQLSQPTQAESTPGNNVRTPESRRSSNHSETQDLSPSALRLLDLIEEALSIPFPTGEDSDNSSSSSSSSENGENHGYRGYDSHSSDEY